LTAVTPSALYVFMIAPPVPATDRAVSGRKNPTRFVSAIAPAAVIGTDRGQGHVLDQAHEDVVLRVGDERGLDPALEREAEVRPADLERRGQGADRDALVVRRRPEDRLAAGPRPGRDRAGRGAELGVVEFRPPVPLRGGRRLVEAAEVVPQEDARDGAGRTEATGIRAQIAGDGSRLVSPDPR
jgi:hypothetical protein